jgi:hypothetical protein
MKFFSVGWILTLSLVVKYKYKTVSDVDKGIAAIVPECMQRVIRCTCVSTMKIVFVS